MYSKKSNTGYRVTKYYLLLLAIVTILTPGEAQERRLVAEWEPTKAIWVQWGEGTYMTSTPIESSIVELVTVISKYHRVKILTESPRLKTNAIHLLQERKIDMAKIDFVNAAAMGAITDPAPAFLQTSAGELATVDFRWNNYGVRPLGHPKTIDTDTFDIEMAKKMRLPVIATSELVWEGGAMDHNGQGTILFAEQWMFQRNPTWTKSQIENELAAKIGIKKVIWLNNGPAEDDFKRILPGEIYPFGTGGHVDEFCRFVNDSTVLLAEVTDLERKNGPIEEENYQRMEENYKRIQAARDQDDKPLQIIRIPSPDLIIKRIPSSEINSWDAAWFPGYETKDSVNLVLASSYLNFLLTDKLVVAAKYWKPGRSASTKRKDIEVRTLLTRLFPEKKVIQLNPEAFNHQGGGFHCYTYNEPVGNLKN